MGNILNINNPSDISKMRNYHRTRDMINLLIYFPECSPIKNLTIFEGVDDYLAHYDKSIGKVGHRFDSLISKPVINSLETGSDKQDFIKIIEKIKEIDSDAVLVMFDLTNEYSERYERYAGISIGISIGNGIYIDAVGQGFDGREVSKGIVTHEGYFIPWMEIMTCNIDGFKNFQIYQINDKEYIKSRQDRIDFLLSLGYKVEKIENHVPKVYNSVPNFIWEDIIKNIIKKIPKMEDELVLCGFNEFAINGHTEGKRFLPWQMFDSGRYILKSKQKSKK